MQYSEKTDRIVYGELSGWSKADMLDLAIALLDQCGASTTYQNDVKDHMENV